MSMPGLTTLRSSNRGGYVLESNAVSLIIRQQPECALLTQENKEKGRKPIDPPPIVQMLVDRSCDPQEQWIVSPYLFIIAVIVEGEEGDTLLPSKYLVGQTSSSLHRLKDIDNKDGGFFVFGDISVRKPGKHRLRFNLFDTDKDTGDVMLLKTVESDVFEVVSNKEFRGLTESTTLSRTFSDQGVRLRLRKESRTIQGGVKRSYGSSEQGSPGIRTSSTAYGGPVHDHSYGAYPSLKRQRTDSEYASTSTPSFYSDVSASFYGANALPSNAVGGSGRWPDQMSKSQTNLGYGMSSRPHTSYSVGSNAANLARAYPTLSQSTGQLSSVGYANRGGGFYDDGYAPQSQQYFTQSQHDPYGSLSGMQAPGSIADSSSLASSSRPGTQGYMSASGDFAAHSGAVHTPQPASHSTPYATDMTAASYSGGRPGSTSIEPSHTYASSSTGAGLSFDQSSQAGLGSSLYSQSGPSSVQNPYAAGMSRMQYPVHPSGVSHTGVPADLFSSTLNTTWPGAGYGEQDSTPVSTSRTNTQSMSSHPASGYSTSSGKQQWQ